MEFRLDDALRRVARPPNVPDAEAGRQQQLAEIALGALLRAQQAHHDDVHGAGDGRDGLVGDDVVADEERAVAVPHGRLEVEEDLAGLLVGPVVQDGLQEVGAGAVHGLRGEEVVRRELEVGVLRLALFDGCREILHDHVRRGGEQRLAQVLHLRA